MDQGQASELGRASLRGVWLPWLLPLAPGGRDQLQCPAKWHSSSSGPDGTGDSIPTTSLCKPCLPFPVTTADLELSGMRTLEHVAVTVTITHPRRGNLEIRLFCPSGMMSLIGTTRSMDS